MKVIICVSQREFSIEVGLQEPVIEIKRKIEQQMGIPIASQTLSVSEFELLDGLDMEDYPIVTEGTKIDLVIGFLQPSNHFSQPCNLREYGIGESSEIVVFRKATNCLREEPAPRRLSLVVQTSSSLLNSSRIPLQMSDSCTVFDLRQWLLNREILPLDDYLFIHRQRIMKNGCSLRWHGVEDGDFLFVFKGTVTRGEF